MIVKRPSLRSGICRDCQAFVLAGEGFLIDRGSSWDLLCKRCGDPKPCAGCGATPMAIGPHHASTCYAFRPT